MPIARCGRFCPNNKDNLFDRLVQKHYNRIYQFCLYRLAQDTFTAEDCTQEVFILLYQNLEKLESPEKIDGWLYKTADHLVKRAYIKAAKEKKRIQSIDADDGYSVYNMLLYEEDYDFEAAAQKDADQCFQTIFKALTDAEIRIWNLYYRQRKPLREVSEILGLSESAVKSRVSRLKRKIIAITHDVLEKE